MFLPFEGARPGVIAMITLEMIGYFFTFNPDHVKFSSIDLDPQGFDLSFDDRSSSAAFAAWAAPQIAVNRAEQQKAKKRPKQTNDGKHDQAYRDKEG